MKSQPGAKVLEEKTHDRRRPDSDARKLLRDSPMGAYQIMVVVICTMLNMIDGFDVLAISFTAPVIAKEWGVAPATLGVLLSAGLAGMCARFASRFIATGRSCGAGAGWSTSLHRSAIISIGMLASAAASNVWELSLCALSHGAWAWAACSRAATRCFQNIPPTGGAILSSLLHGRGLSRRARSSAARSSAYLGSRHFGWRAAFICSAACVLRDAAAGASVHPARIDRFHSQPAPWQGDAPLTRVNIVMRRLGPCALLGGAA